MSVDKQVATTIANLKAVRASFHIYALQSRTHHAQATFKSAYQDISDILSDLENRYLTLLYEEPQYRPS